MVSSYVFLGEQLYVLWWAGVCSKMSRGITLGAEMPRFPRVVSRPPSSYSMRLLSRVSSEMWSTVWEPMVCPSSLMR